MTQRRMRLRQEIRVAKKRNFELIRPKLDDIKFGVQLMLRLQYGQNLIQFRPKTRVPLPEDINRRWQPFAIFQGRQVPLIFLKLHTPR